MTLLVLTYNLRYLSNERLGIISDLTLTQTLFDCIFKLLKKSFCQGLKNFCNCFTVFRKQKTFTTPQKLLVQQSVDKID